MIWVFTVIDVLWVDEIPFDSKIIYTAGQQT